MECSHCLSQTPSFICGGCLDSHYCNEECQRADFDLHQWECVGRAYSKRQKAKIRRVLREYKKGTLRSGSGKRVTSRDQALAIALSEARGVK